MNPKITTLFLLIACLALPVGCDKTASEEPLPGAAVEVRVAPPAWGQQTATTYAPLTGWYNTPTHMAYAQNSSSAFPAAGYTLALKGTVHNNITTFMPLLFYPANSDYIFLQGFYPRATGLTLNGSGIEQIPGTGKISYTIDGSQDIMSSNRVSGNSGNTIAASGAQLYFSHLLTQFSFILISDGSFPSSAKVKSIELRNVSVAAELDLPTNVLAFTDANNSVITAYTNATGYVVTATAQTQQPMPIGNVMFQPGGELRNNFQLVVVVGMSTGDMDCVVQNLTLPSSPSQAGTHYRITLTFSAVAITPVITATLATVTPGEWPTTNYW